MSHMCFQWFTIHDSESLINNIVIKNNQSSMSG